MNPYIERVKQQIEKHPPGFGDGNSILALLHKAYNEVNRLDDEQIRADFNALYQAMNGIELREMDRIISLIAQEPDLTHGQIRFFFVPGFLLGQYQHSVKV